MQGRERKKYLIKNTGIFALSNFGTKLISFFLVPIYTNALSTDQYGTVDLIYTIAIVIVPFITFNIGDAIMRFALDKDANHNEIMSTGFVFIGIALVISILVFPICSFFEQIKDYSLYLFLYIVSFSISQVFLCYLRGIESLLKYSIGNILNMLFIGLFNIVFLLVCHMGVKGYLSAYILASILTAIYAFFSGNLLNVIKSFRFNKELTKSMVRYSIVLIPTSFMWWIMNSSDRIMVTAMVGISANGLYAIAYKIPTMLSTLSSIFNQAWSYSAIKEQESDDRDEYSNSIYKGFVSVTLLTATGLMMVMKTFLKVYVTKDYYYAWEYTPFLMIGFVFMTLASFLATSYTVHKDSKGFLLSGLSGAILNVILNLIFIPIVGVNGAAFATCISYFTVFLYRAVDTKKYQIIKIISTKDVVGFFILLVCAFSIYIDNQCGQAIQCLSFIAIMLLYRDACKVIVNNLFYRIRDKQSNEKNYDK